MREPKRGKEADCVSLLHCRPLNKQQGPQVGIEGKAYMSEWVEFDTGLDTSIIKMRLFMCLKLTRGYI